ncbi:MAG TPA: hypothetical protein PLK28_13850 [Candidatus Rifleibacterium sp.]|nr:hypothetical protein [Candidatus Rifleibacterium sp.]
MGKTPQKTGQAGIIMIMLIFGLLMTVSTAYMKMVQTEVEVQGMVDNSDRAMDAAFSGISYAIAIAQSNKSMFINKVEAVASRTYIIASTTSLSDWTSLNAAWTTTKVNKVASVPADWLFLNETLDLYKINEQAASPPYFFRVTSFPAASTTAVADPEKYVIKSQGRFLHYSDDKATVLATFSAQLIAECKIMFNRKIVQLYRYRYMPFQKGNDFFEYSPY